MMKRRITEECHAECVQYTDLVKKQVANAFYMAQLRTLLNNIRTESDRLRSVVLTAEEIKERQKTLDDFNAKMQAMAFYTIKNMDKYRLNGWKEIIEDGELQDE